MYIHGWWFQPESSSMASCEVTWPVAPPALRMPMDAGRGTQRRWVGAVFGVASGKRLDNYGKSPFLMENHHFSWANQRTQWQFSIAA